VKEVSIPDPLDDLYSWDGIPASGYDWQDITKVETVRTADVITMTLNVNGEYPDMSDFRDGVILILFDIDEDGHVVPSEGPIDFYSGNLDYGIFISSPEFGEPPIFIEDLRLMGHGTYETAGVKFSIEGNKIMIEIKLSHIGNPEGTIKFVAAIKTGITGVPIEDRVPNEELAEIADP
jgi:hypothetical protein